MAFTQPDATAAHVPPAKSIVVGIYGMPGCGKTFLLKQLKAELGETVFGYYEGSTIISSLVAGGLDAFKKLDDERKGSMREQAIFKIAQECSSTQRVGVVAGHFLFWEVNDGSVSERPPLPIWTEGDAKTYTHIFYLEVPPAVVKQRRQDDSTRKRPATSVEHLERWQSTEIAQLGDICLEHGISFSVIPHSKVSELPTLLRDISEEQDNLSLVKCHLDTSLRNLSGPGTSNVVFVFDGDRTLIPEDTGALFVKLMRDGGLVEDDPLKAIFSSSLGYSYAAFRRVADVYDALPEQTFHNYCQQVAVSVKIHPEIVSLLRKAGEQGVSVLVVTCGLQDIWEVILNAAGLSNTVKVIGSGRSKDVIITGEVKYALVSRLRDVHHQYVCAFGDSPLDLPMLKEADRAIVVVGEKMKRSSTMDKALLHAIEEEGLHACQLLLPSTVSPRLDTVKLPITDITSPHFILSVVSPIKLTNDNAAKLLMTPMRDATVRGPALRKAHGEVGWHLATTLLSECIGLEEYSIPHVQGNQTIGYRFRNEEKTLIVALMRGGEPLALGVSEAMPLAMFLHAKESSDVKKHHVEGQETIILVDSVINSGDSVVEFMARIRELNETARIVVVAGVVQSKALSRTKLAQFLTADSKLGSQIVALRKSDNKFTGRGGTDTGNRLFNSTRLD